MKRDLIVCVSDSQYVGQVVLRIVRRYIGINLLVTRINYGLFETWANNVSAFNIRAVILSEPSKGIGLKAADIVKRRFPGAAMLAMWPDVDEEVAKSIEELGFSNFAVVDGTLTSDRVFSKMLKRAFRGEPMLEFA